jgi:hypothetical protein
MSINIGRQVNLIGFHRNGSIGSLYRACQEPKSAAVKREAEEAWVATP